MSIFAVCGAAIVFCCGGVILRAIKPELSPAYTAVSVCILTCCCINAVSPLIAELVSLANTSGIGNWISLLLKAIAASIGCETAADLCKDCGESSIASKIEFMCRIYILLLSLPLIKQVIDVTRGLL